MVTKMFKYSQVIKIIIIFFCFNLFNISFAKSHNIDQSQIERIIEEYLIKNPESIKSTLEKLDETLKRKKFQDTITLLNKANNPSIKHNNFDITIYEFFDYNCGYCKSVLPLVTDIIKEDKNVNFVFVEFPILSQDSYTASLATLAAQKQNLYNEFHISLMSVKGKIDEGQIFKTAKQIGLDINKLKIDMENPEITLTLEKNREVAKLFQLNGTPAFIIGNKIYPGAVSKNQLKEAIKIYRNR